MHTQNKFLLLFFFIIMIFSPPGLCHAYTQVAFVGNTVVDLEWDYSCCSFEYYSVFRDGVEIAKILDSDTTFYRDDSVSKGEEHTYQVCQISYPNSSSQCGSKEMTVTVGEVKGRIYQDLTWNSGLYELYGYVTIDNQATLSVEPGVIIKGVYEYDRSNLSIDGKNGHVKIDGAAIEGINCSFGDGRNWLKNSSVTGQEFNSVIISSGNDGQLELSGNDFSYADIRYGYQSGGLIDNNDLVNTYLSVDSENPQSNITISNNRITNGHLHLDGEAIFLVENNGFIYQPEHGYGSAISTFDVSSLTIRSNSFSLMPINDALYIDHNSKAVIEHNTIENCASGLSIGVSSIMYSETHGSVTFTGNNISNCEYGVKLYSGNTTLSNNNIQSNSTGIYINFVFSDNASAPIHENCITGNTSYGIQANINLSPLLDAKNNWWGAASGPTIHTNPGGSGDAVYLYQDNPAYETVSYKPWITASNCQQVPIPPEPAALLVTTDKDTLPADGHSQALLTITLQDKNSQPVANAELTIDTPEFGSLDRLSGSTDASGKLLLNYTAPTAAELNGKDFVELTIHYPEAAISDSAIIDFTFASVDIWADPHLSPYPSDVAIIPGDSRFPGRYQFTLRDYNRQIYAGETLTISIADSNRARLEGDGQSGGQINVLTDEQGRVIVDYIYLGTPKIGNIPFEDTITVSHKALSEPVTAAVSIGLDIEIADVTTPQKDTGRFPKALGMRLLLRDSFRPSMDLSAYLSELKEISAHNIAMKLITGWINAPKPELIDTFRSIFPNYANDDPPELYEGIGVINYADNKLKQVIVEAMDKPQVGFGANTLPAIIFEDAGNYWFRVQVNPVILPAGAKSSSDFVRGAGRPDLGRLFAANVLEGTESVFQSVVCSVKPTTKAQFVAMTLFVSNPYFKLVPPIAALNMMTKASGIICDYMQGNYVTAAINMASLGADGLENAYTSGALDISLEQYLKLGKIVRLNQTYSKVDNMKSAKEMFIAKRSELRADKLLSVMDNWPEDLSLAEYKDIMNKTVSGELAAYDDLKQWQSFGILNNDEVTMSRVPDETEYFSHDGVHVFLLPTAADMIFINTSSDADIYRFYRAAVDEIYTAEYTFPAADIDSLLNFSLLEAELQVDTGADGSIDDSFLPEIKKVDTTWTALEVITNQDTYQAGDTLTISATFENPGDALLVDVYFSVTSPAGELYSIPDLSPGHTPLVTNFEMPGHFVLPETTIFTFPVPAGLTGAGEFKIEAFLSYPGTLNAVGGNISSKIISFP